MEEHERIELRSDEVQEIIGTPPRWIVRWGTFIICMALAALVSMSFYVEYPDKVIGRVTISSLTAPAKIPMPQTGAIAQLLVRDGATVEKGDLLVVLQDASNYEDVIDLEEMMEPLQNASKGRLSGFTIDPNEVFELGNLQQYYSSFQLALKTYQLNEVIGDDKKMIAQKQRQVRDVRNNIKIIKKRSELAAEQERLAYDKFKNYEGLFKADAIKEEAVRNQYQLFLDKKNVVEAYNQEIGEKNLQISNLGAEIEAIRNRGSKDSNERFIALQTSINNLTNAINTWQESFLVTAPIGGKVSMIKNYSEQERLDAGTEIFAILAPDTDENKYIEFLIPFPRSGKVAVGQKVNIKFDNFPYREHGMVEAVVTGIDELPRESNLNVKIDLVDGLRTGPEKVLPFTQQMQGYGEIITEKRSVFTRIFENVIKPFLDQG